MTIDNKTTELQQNDPNSKNEKLISVMLANYATKWVDLSNLSKEEKAKKERDLEQVVKKLTHALGAQDLLQNMLAVQMLGVHELQQTLMLYANKSLHDPQYGQYYLNAITKLSNVFIQQANTLQKLQSGCQQKVVVEHLHINEGGQAIVGQVHAVKRRGKQ